MDISRTTTQKARKSHRCSWCAELIAVGEIYHRWTCFDNNSADTVKMHNECRDAMHDASDEFDDDRFDLYQNTREGEKPAS